MEGTATRDDGETGERAWRAQIHAMTRDRGSKWRGYGREYRRGYRRV